MILSFITPRTVQCSLTSLLEPEHITITKELTVPSIEWHQSFLCVSRMKKKGYSFPGTLRDDLFSSIIFLNYFFLRLKCRRRSTSTGLLEPYPNSRTGEHVQPPLVIASWFRNLRHLTTFNTAWVSAQTRIPGENLLKCLHLHSSSNTLQENSLIFTKVTLVSLRVYK